MNSFSTAFNAAQKKDKEKERTELPVVSQRTNDAGSGFSAAFNKAQAGTKSVAPLYTNNPEDRLMRLAMETVQPATRRDNHDRYHDAQAAGVSTFRPGYGYGNINLNDRPVYRNADGTVSTVDSFSTNIDGREVLLPQIGRDAQGNAVRWTQDQAIDNYLKTGENLGKFKSVEDANAYADWLHNQQAGLYGQNEPDYYIPQYGAPEVGIPEPESYVSYVSTPEKEKSGNALAAGHGAVWRGMSNFEQRTYEGIDFLNRMVHQYLLGMTPEEYESENTITSQLARHGAQNVETWDAYTKANQGDSKAANIATELISETVAALPYSIMAILSAGTSTALSASQGISGIGATAADLTNIANAATTTGKIAFAANSARTAVATMVQDPQYWFTVLQEIGGSYNQAKADGATEDKAVLYATVNALANALVEIGGGGIQELPQQLRGGSEHAIRSWVDSMIDEGKEEVVQGVIERGLQVLYGKNNEVFSTTNPDAIFNPLTGAKEFGMGAAVGGILGAGQLGLDLTMNAASRRAGNIPTENIVNIQSEQPTVNEGLMKLAQEMANDEVAQAAAEAEAPVVPRPVVPAVEAPAVQERPSTQETQPTQQETELPARAEEAEIPEAKETLPEVRTERGIGEAEKIRNGLMNSGRVNVGNFEYTLTKIAGPEGKPIFAIKIRNSSEDIPGVASNARSIFNGYENTREEAINTLVEVAQNNGLISQETVQNAPEVQPVQEQQKEETAPAAEETAAVNAAPAAKTNPPAVAPFSKTAENRFKKASKVGSYKYGDGYFITDGYVVLRTDESGADYISKLRNSPVSTQEFPKMVSDRLDSAARNDKLITEDPYVSHDTDRTVYIFDTPDGQIAFDKKLFDLIDGGELHYTDYGGLPGGMLVATDGNGNVTGAIFGIKREPSRLEILDRAKIKSVHKPIATTTKTGYNTTKETAPKEGVNNGSETVAEVSDGTGVLASPARGPRDGGLLDGVASENVPAPAERGGESGGVLRPEGERVRGNARGSDAAGNGRGRSVGSREGGNLPSAGEVTTEETTPAEAGEKPLTVKEQTEQEIKVKDETATQEKPKGNNFVIPAEGLKLPNGEKARYKANIAAIKTLRTLMAEGRFATPEEQEILSKYVGWGGLANAFDERKSEWTKEYKQLKDILTDAEYKAARGSTLNAHYTDVGVIRGIYTGLEGLGFTGGRLLEPSAGVGHFAGAMPENLLPGVKSWTMVELDEITGNIAKYLYPNADVRVQGFEKAILPDNYMDMAISNVPFGNYGIADKSYPKEVTSAIHNYFFAKALDKVRPGGLVTFITSRYTMDASDSAVRKYIMKRADLLGAIRLPDTAFQGNAGTEVVTDILVLKKREPGTPYKGEAFENTDNYHWRDLGIWDQTNEYFQNHPEMVLGEASNGGSMYRSRSLTYVPKNTRLSLQKQIEKAFTNIKGKMDYPAQQTPEQVRREIKDGGNRKNGSYVKKDGKLYQVKDGELAETTLEGKQAETVEAAIGIRDAGRALLDAQIADQGASAIKIARDNLNALYDEFVKKYGPLHKPANARMIREDADSPFIMALENYDKETGKATKADIFTKNTVSPNVTVTHVNTVEEGLTVVMNETGGVDAKRIAELTGESEKAVTARLLDTGLAFLNRDGNLETAEQYLSGNVKAKLRDAEALAEIDKTYQKNVEALKKIIPADIAAEDISVRPGATWIPDGTYADFAAEMLGSSNRGYRPAVTVQYNRQIGQYNITLNEAWLKNRPENISTWGTPDRSFINILNATLNNKNVTVWRKQSDGSRILDKQATAAAQEKQEKILAEFQNWIWKDDARKTELAKLYNDVFNNTVTPKYDGSNLTVNGANVEKPLREHQRNAVQRIISSGGNTLLAHRVGAGKTYEMAAAAMKLRQLGIVKKPLFVVPKSLVAQWGNEFLDFFPAAKVLVTSANDFAKANRKTFTNRIATGDFDAVIMSQEQFKAIPMSVENQEAFYQQQIDELEEAKLAAAAANGKRDPSIKQLEKAKKSLEAKLKKLGDMKKDEDNIDFESLGVDSLFVDEAHSYKNLFYTTNMNNVSGLGNKEGSQKAFDLYMKTRYLQKLNGGRGIVFATATPVMNSMSEMYIMQKYLQGDLLDARGLTSFDAWANQFGEVRTVLEMNPSGKGFRQKQSFSKFKNLAELQQMFRSFADVVTEVPGLKIPTMKTGKRIIVESEPSDFQMQYIDKLAERADAIKNGRVDPHEDNMLKITSEGRKLSYTQRMIDPSLPYEEGNKIMKAAQNVYDIWKESAKNKGTQLVFCDLSTPKGGAQTADTETAGEITTAPDVEDISIYDDIKNVLVGMGIPAKEIAFIHEANTDEKKSKLFADVNDGNVRVLIGSTGKMGVGMNAQKRIVALHHLDAPWRPGDIEQREGRALRQKNMNDEVGVYVYVTKKTFDSRMWDNLQRKAGFIHQVMAGDLTAREAEGDGDFALSAAEIKAISSGNPLIMEQFEVAAEIAKLESLERAHNKEVADARARLAKTHAAIASDEEYLQKLEHDAKARIDTTGDKFTAQIGGKTINDRKAAGEAIIAQAKKYLKIDRNSEEAYPIGKFAGFDLYVTNGGDMLLRGEAQYRASVNMQSAPGTVQALEAMAKRIDTMLDGTKARLAENRSAIAKLEKIAASSFDRAEELSEVRRRNAEIMAELNPDDGNAAEMDDDGEDEEVFSSPTATPVKQEIGSAGTSIKQIPALFTDPRVEWGETNIDIGGGKFDLATDYLREKGVLNLVFDPYNRSDAVNADTLNWLRSGYRADTATCANVLNVIAEENARANVILEMAKAIKPDGKAYFMVYEGNGSGIGRMTKTGSSTSWQNNRKTETYVSEIKKYFRNVVRRGKLIIATLPNENLPKAVWETSPGNAVEYSRAANISRPEQWTAQRVGSKDKKPMGLSEIIEKIRHDFGLNITTGHIRGAGVLGQYRPDDQGIRSRVANDLPTVAHELGHYFDRTYDMVGDMPEAAKKEIVKNLDPAFAAQYKEEKLPREGVAEFLRRYLQNSETAAIDYPEFTKWFLNTISGPDAAQIMQLADEVNAYYSMDADTAQSSIRLREEGRPDARTLGEKIRQKASNFYQSWIDSNRGIKEFDRATGANTYKLATNAAYADARAGAAITGNLYDIDGAYVAPGLKSCFAGHEKYLTDKSLYKTLGEYLIVKHGPERLAEGMRVFADDRKNSTAWMKRRQMEMEQEHPELEEISDKLYEFQKQFLQTWGVDTGLVSQESADEWAERWEYYVPFNRAVPMEARGIGAKRGFANQTSTIHKAVGSGLDIVHPVDNIINNIVKMVNAGIRNGVMQRLTNSAEQNGDATFLEKVPMPVKKKTFDMRGVKAELKNKVDERSITDATEIYGIIEGLDDILEQYGRGKAYGDVVTVLKNGSPQYWKINDPLLLASITNMAPKKMEGILDAYAQVSRFMMSNITGNNIIWSIFSNFPRDLGTFFTYSKVKNPVRAFASMGSAYVNKFKGDHADPLYMEYLAMGGGNNSAYTADRDLAKRAREKLSGKNIDANPLNWIAFASDTIEMGPRFATYKMMRENGLTPQEAFYEAMDVTTNFRRGGRVAREINKVVPFFNAGVQGLDKFARWITADDAPQADRNKVRRGRMFGFLAASAAIAAAFYFLNNRDDESEKEYEQLSNYTKNSYWNIPLGDGKYFAIPKPREIAVLSSFFETCMEYGIGKNDHAFDEFYDYAANTCLPNVAADLAQGDWQGAIGSLGIIGIGAYLMANRDFLGKPIESAGMQYLEPRDRYNARTSKIAYALGQALNVSPQKVDYFFSQVLGGWWKSQKALFPVGGENVDYTLGVQNTYVKDNQYSTDIVNRLYDMAEKSAQAKGSDPGDIEKAISAKRDDSMTTFYSRYNSLAKNTSSTASRSTRQVVLDMILEYEKAAEAGTYTKAEKAVLDVVRKNGDPGVYMPSVMNTVVKDGNGKQHELSDVQYVEYQTDYLRLYYQIIEDAIPFAKNADERAAIVKHAKDTAKNDATARTLGRIGAPKVTDKYDGVSNKNVTIFTGLLDIADDDGGLKQTEVIEAIERMQARGLSDSDAYKLFHSRYDSDKNNPWAK